MKRASFRTAPGSLLLWALWGLGACGGGGTGTDMRAPDLSRLADLSVSPDSATPPDLTPATVTGLPANCTGTVTANKLYTDIVKGTCALDQCHGTNSTNFSIMSATDVTGMWVNKPADEASMNRVTPNNVDKSYVMYKLTGEQLKVTDAAIGGGRMPLTGPPFLTDAQICEFVQWIKGGAM